MEMQQDKVFSPFLHNASTTLCVGVLLELALLARERHGEITTMVGLVICDDYTVLRSSGSGSGSEYDVPLRSPSLMLTETLINSLSTGLDLPTSSWLQAQARGMGSG